MSEPEYNGVRQELDIGDFAKSLRDLPEVVLTAAKRSWYKAGAAHLARTKANTPVGVYPDEVDFWTKDGQHVHFRIKKHRVGGQLRLRWQQTPVSIQGNEITTVVFNNVEYAPYVEFGHRLRNKNGETIGYVPGRYMMTKSLQVFQEVDGPAAVDEIMEAIRQAFKPR